MGNKTTHVLGVDELLRFSRKATYEDFDKVTEKWVMALSHETREALKNGALGSRARIKKDLQCSIQEAAEVQKDYLAYWGALQDFVNGKDVFVDY